jgi:hypothetical protein
MTSAEGDREGAGGIVLLFLALVEAPVEVWFVSAGDSPTTAFLFFFAIAH